MLSQSVNRLMFLGLAAVIGFSSQSATAQVLPLPVTCQATIGIGQGASFTYRLTGVFPDAIAPNTPQNPVGRIVTMTVERRDRTGRVQTLLKAPVNDYEQVAPDADYSKLPFTGVFRGQPNNGFRLYSVSGSTHGLYLSLRPTKGQPQQMQIVHYLSPGKFVRSAPGTCK
jgi:hypothetical protein